MGRWLMPSNPRDPWGPRGPWDAQVLAGPDGGRRQPPALPYKLFQLVALVSLATSRFDPRALIVIVVTHIHIGPSQSLLEQHVIEDHSHELT